MKKKEQHHVSLPLALSILLFSIVFIFLAFVFQKNLAQFQSFGLVGIFLINFFGSATVFLPTPAVASVFAGGVVYPFLFVALASSLGSSLGEVTGFLIGHSGKHVIFRKNHHILYATFRDLFKKYGGGIIFFFGLIPNPFFDAIGIIAGALSYPPVPFFLFIFAGRFLRDILLASIGASFAN